MCNNHCNYWTKLSIWWRKMCERNSTTLDYFLGRHKITSCFITIWFHANYTFPSATQILAKLHYKSIKIMFFCSHIIGRLQRAHDYMQWLRIHVTRLNGWTWHCGHTAFVQYLSSFHTDVYSFQRQFSFNELLLFYGFLKPVSGSVQENAFKSWVDNFNRLRVNKVLSKSSNLNF